MKIPSLACMIVAITTNIMAQNVGIGTEEPQSTLHVLGDIRADSLSIVGDSTHEAVLLFENTRSMIEQDHYTGYYGAETPGWQSFTATSDGLSLRVCLSYLLSSSFSQVKLYAGHGISDSMELQSLNVSITGAGMISLPPFSLEIDSGAVYTVWINNIKGVTTGAPNPYPAGLSSIDPGIDLVFRIYIMSSTPVEVHGNGTSMLTLRDNARLEVDGVIATNEIRVTKYLGIGTSEPNHPLTIQGNGFQMNLMGFNDYTGYKQWSWEWVNAVDMALYSASHSPSLVIRQSGNIGAGTIQPLAKIHLAKNASSAGTNDFMLLQNQGTGGVGLKLQRSGSPAWQFYLENDGSFRLGQYLVADYLKINQSGDVGLGYFLCIGTFDPNYRLDIQAPGPNTTIANFRSTGGRCDLLIQNGTQQLKVGVVDTGGYVRTQSPHDLHLQANGITRLFIKHSSGAIGIGTTQPQYRLDVQSTASDVILARFKTSGGYGEIHAGNGTNTLKLGANAQGCYIGTYSDSDLRFRINNNVRMMIRQSDGFVGIGTEFPLARLEVNGDVVIAGSIINDAMQLPVLQNNWVNYDAGFETAGYFKDKFGMVHLKGLVRSGTSAHIMTLPEGYRPVGQLLFTVVSGNGFARLDVKSNGDVTLIGTYSSDYVSLTGISFRVN